MSNIIVPGPFAQLLTDPGAVAHVGERLTRTIEHSFHEDRTRRDGVRPPPETIAEVKRRFAICERWFRVMRAEFGWSVRRTLDALPYALRAELDGLTYDQARRQVSMWPVTGTARPAIAQGGDLHDLPRRGPSR